MVMGRMHVSIHCVNHGERYGHVVWSKGMSAGDLAPAKQLAVLALALQLADRSYMMGEWEFFDDC
jgi:hypothetical protein